jgi:hypothetical protein
MPLPYSTVHVLLTYLERGVEATGSRSHVAAPSGQRDLQQDKPPLRTRGILCRRGHAVLATTHPAVREVTVVEIELRVGGKWRDVMVADDGIEVGFHGEYGEIVPDERIDDFPVAIRSGRWDDRVEDSA